MPGGGAGPGAGPGVASHHWVTGAGSSASRASRACTEPRSTMSAPPLPDTVGNVRTAATIFTLTTAPSMRVCTVEPTLALLAVR